MYSIEISSKKFRGLGLLKQHSEWFLMQEWSRIYWLKTSKQCTDFRLKLLLIKFCLFVEISVPSQVAFSRTKSTDFPIKTTSSLVLVSLPCRWSIGYA
jgi:hypothetical protein